MPEHATQSAAPIAYTAQLSARYHNFLSPLLTLAALGGVCALTHARSGIDGAGWWPVVWMATAIAGVFFSAVFMLMCGSRRLPTTYSIALSAAVGIAVAVYGVLLASLHAPWGATLPMWLRSGPVRAMIQWPWAPLLPYAAGLVLHGLAIGVFSHPQPPESRG